MVFAPSSIQEIVDLMGKAFDLAEEYRMPSLILADGMLGQMMEPVEFPESNCHTKEKTWALTGHKNKRPPNIVNSLYLNPSELEQTILNRFERYRIIEEREAVAESLFMEDAQYAVTAYGIAARVVKSAVQAARAEGKDWADSSHYRLALSPKGIRRRRNFRRYLMRGTQYGANGGRCASCGQRSLSSGVYWPDRWLGAYPR